MRAMVFIDYENFEIERIKAYGKSGGTGQPPRLDLTKLPKKITEKTNMDLELIKTFLFVPKPDDILSKIEWRQNRYSFLVGLENTDFFTVISGRHVVRPKNGDFQSIDIDDKDTFFIVEKGTDINIATQLLTKAFHNSYDVAIVVSGDTDYLPVYDVLNTLGKSVIVVANAGQNLSKLKTHTDKQMLLDSDFLKDCESCYRKNKA